MHARCVCLAMTVKMSRPIENNEVYLIQCGVGHAKRKTTLNASSRVSAKSTGLTLISGRFPFSPLFTILDHHHILYCNYVVTKTFMPRSRSVDIMLYASMMMLRND